jgi:hypothetical protein
MGFQAHDRRGMARLARLRIARSMFGFGCGVAIIRRVMLIHRALNATTALDPRGFLMLLRRGGCHARGSEAAQLFLSSAACSWLTDGRLPHLYIHNRISNATARATHPSVDTDSKGPLSINKL